MLNINNPQRQNANNTLKLTCKLMKVLICIEDEMSRTLSLLWYYNEFAEFSVMTCKGTKFSSIISTWSIIFLNNTIVIQIEDVVLRGISARRLGINSGRTFTGIYRE